LLDQLSSGADAAASAGLPRPHRLSDEEAASFSMEKSITKLISQLSTLPKETES
jgi:hypothetical protein